MADSPPGEVQTCPSRLAQCGPWEHKEGLDRWLADRWSADREAAARKHAEQDARLGPNCTAYRGPNNGLWLWPWGPPRTCSFCGGIHPEDAIRLVDEGWEVEGTGKSYKRYLEPPGTCARNHAFLASIRDQSREPGEGVPSVWSPTPPVKLYVYHFDEDQARRFNEALSRHPAPEGP
jgi:hypothetical protein